MLGQNLLFTWSKVTSEESNAKNTLKTIVNPTVLAETNERNHTVETLPKSKGSVLSLTDGIECGGKDHH